MAKNHTFARNDTFPSWWANALGEQVGTLVSGVELRKSSATAVEVPAGTFDDQVGITIDGKWRYRTTLVSRTHPGGVAGTYPVFAVCKENSIVATPLPFTDATDYNWDLRIEAPGATPTIVPGTVDFFRKIGDIEWDGAAITRVHQTAGQRSQFPVSPTARRADEIPVRIRGFTGQTANLQEIQDSGGVLRWAIGPAGGGVSRRAAASDTVLDAAVAADAQARFLIRSNGSIEWGPGNAARDAALSYEGAGLGLLIGNKLRISSELELDGALNHDGTQVGFFGVAPVARPAATDEIKAALALLGLLTDGGASPLNLDGGALTVGALTATGNASIGDADTDTLGFFSIAGVARQAATADIKDALAAYGLLTNGGASPLNLDGGALTAGAATVAALTATGNVRLGDADADTVGFFSVAGTARTGATADIKDALAGYGLLTNGGASPLNLDGGALAAGAATFSGTAQLDGVLDHNGAQVGFYGAAPVAQEAGWTTPLLGSGSMTAYRTPLDDASTLLQTKRYVATLAQRLFNLGLIGT